jgi:hypothetical protein
MGLSPSVAESFVELNKGIIENPNIFGLSRTTERTTATSIEEFAQVFSAVYKS